MYNIIQHKTDCWQSWSRTDKLPIHCTYFSSNALHPGQQK